MNVNETVSAWSVLVTAVFTCVLRGTRGDIKVVGLRVSKYVLLGGKRGGQDVIICRSERGVGNVTRGENVFWELVSQLSHLFLPQFTYSVRSK